MAWGSGYGSETGSVPKKKENKSTMDIGTSLTSEFRDNEESYNNLLQLGLH